ncbi:MAG: hypothetical protein AVDCRST_MAG96-2105, partial [uncultured Segetibacter sp.]
QKIITAIKNEQRINTFCLFEFTFIFTVFFCMTHNLNVYAVAPFKKHQLQLTIKAN